MKYRRDNFLKFPIEVIYAAKPENVPEKYKGLSSHAIHLFLILLAFENKFITKSKSSFSQSNENLANRMGVSIPTLKKAKKELINAGLIECWKEAAPSKIIGKKTTLTYCHYRILI